MRGVAVVGGGASAWTAAIALHRAFARLGVTVTMVETPSTTPPGSVLATLPERALFHKLLGIGEADLFRAADATFTLGQQFVGWSGDAGPPFLHAYGETGRAIADLPFTQFWTKARANGMAAAYDDFSLAAAAARAGRMPRAGEGKAVAHGYHLDAQGYERLLRAQAVALGIAIIGDANPQPEVAGDRIAALRLSDGRDIVADLYVDATGRAARLIGALPGADTMAEPTTPCDRMLIADAPPLAPPPLYSRIAAHRAGWIGLFPLGRRTAVTMAYASSHMSDDEAAGSLSALAGLRGIAVTARVPIDERLRLRPWIGNCVAIGEAAAAGDPIDAVVPQRTQIGIAHLVALLPVDAEQMIERDIYNEEVVAHQRRLRDFQTAHYRLNARVGEPFWDAVRERSVGDDLLAKLDLFAARGMVAQYNHETFNTDSWQAMLIGHGLIPRTYDPQVDAVPDADIARALQAMLGAIRADVGAMETHLAARRRIAAAR